MSKDVPWPVWAFVTIVVAAIGAYAVIQGRAPQESTPSGPSIPNPVDPGRPDISGKYFMDNLNHRVIVVTRLDSVSFRAEEPSGSWPWEGTMILKNDSFEGLAKFRNNQSTMRVEGIVRPDRSIAIKYVFLTDEQGKSQVGRIDNHVWYPAP